MYCGNCIGVCPTGALMFTSEHDKREDGTWDETQQTVVDTICPYCGVGCELELHVQDNEIVKVTSPWDNTITNGHLCIKGRFGFAFVQARKGEDPAAMKRKRDESERTTEGATGIVLAGGRSTRFGSDKLAAIHRGIPLLHHAVPASGRGVCGGRRGHRARGSGAVDAVAAPRVRFVRDAGRARARSWGC